MTPEKICEVVALYRKLLQEMHIPKQRMDLARTLKSLSERERLAHAHHLLDGIEVYAHQPGKEGKTGRHLASVQMILSFAGVYTLEELMDHNRPV